MPMDDESIYHEDLVVTTIFNVGHPNYIGRHLRFRRIGSNILILVAICAIATAFYFYVLELLIISAPIVLGAGVWFFFNERKIREINKDLDGEPIEIAGVIKRERQSIRPGQYPYPGGFVNLEGHNALFRADTTFIRRIHIGQKVRFICTPKLKFIKAWQLIK